MVENLTKAVDTMFEHLHLDGLVSPIYRYIIMGAIVTCPVWFLIILMCLGDIDNKRRRDSKHSSKLAKEERLKDKIKRKVEREYRAEQSRKLMEARGKRH